MDLTEEGLLEAIRRVLSGAGPEVRVGVGDDAAVLAPTGGELVITTDAMVEDVHFVRGPSGRTRSGAQGDRGERERHRGDGGQPARGGLRA